MTVFWYHNFPRKCILWKISIFWDRRQSLSRPLHSSLLTKTAFDDTRSLPSLIKNQGLKKCIEIGSNLLASAMTLLQIIVQIVLIVVLGCIGPARITYLNSIFWLSLSRFSNKSDVIHGFIRLQGRPAQKPQDKPTVTDKRVLSARTIWFIVALTIFANTIYSSQHSSSYSTLAMPSLC